MSHQAKGLLTLNFIETWFTSKLKVLSFSNTYGSLFPCDKHRPYLKSVLAMATYCFYKNTDVPLIVKSIVQLNAQAKLSHAQPSQTSPSQAELPELS